MSEASDYLENEILDHFFGGAATIYIALYSAAPNDAGGGTEISGNGYARQSVPFGTASGGSIASNADVTFTASGGAWSEVTHFGLFDASTGGNLLVHSAVDASFTLADTDVYTFSSGNITVDQG